MVESILAVERLNVEFDTGEGPVHAVRDLSFQLAAGETLGIVGESGSGKSQTVLAIMGLLAANGSASGSARFDDRELLGLPVKALNRIRGARISMIFQDPMTSLNPHLTIGTQMSQVLVRHRDCSRRDALEQCAAMLECVHIPEARRRLGMYPHELSGGMRQRVMIASALLCRPSLLIADEPTTAVDVTVQAQILDLLRELQTEFGTAILLITHDMGVVAGSCDRMLVMQDGECREHGTVDTVFSEPADDYTQALLAAVPRLDEDRAARLAAVSDVGGPAAAAPIHTAGELLLEVDGLAVQYPVRQTGLFSPTRVLHAVDDAAFRLHAGETIGIVGESGCGKSSLARAILQLTDTAGGRILFLGRDVSGLDKQSRHDMRRNMQVIFQDPLASLNPRMTVGDIIGEPLDTFFPHLSAGEKAQRVLAGLERVGLEPQHINRYPHEFSGGQCQRIGIARALMFEPQLIICDEPVSALDVSIQAQIINLLMDLQRDMGLSLVFIAHDLAVVRHISNRVLVMYLGRVVEIADRDALYETPMHPYTRALISAVPIPDPKVERARSRELLTGEPPSPLDPPSGCAFRTRCPYAIERCAAERPALRSVDNGLVACHRAGEID